MCSSSFAVSRIGASWNSSTEAAMRGPFINPFDANVLFQRAALSMRNPLVNPLDFTSYPREDTPNTFLRWALHRRPPANSAFQRPDADCDYNNPATFHQRILSRVETSPGTAADTWRVEVARFEAPLGTTGIIRAVEQYLALGATIYSSSAYWGNPQATSFGTWYMRIQLLTRPAPAWVSMLAPGTLTMPGVRYPEWEPSEGMWFPAGSAAAHHHHMVVPAGYMARMFFVYDGSQNDVPTVGCQLRGSLHNQYAPETKAVLRELW